MSSAASSRPVLDIITIAVPCTVPWSSMTGDDRVRHCAECQLDVFNISEMTRDEAESLIASRAGQRICGRFYRRPDGTVMTRDCFSIRRAAGHTAAAIVAVAAGILVAIVSCAGWTFAAVGKQDAIARYRLSNMQPFRAIRDWLDPPQVYAMGDVIVPTVATATWTEGDESDENVEGETEPAEIAP